MESRVVVYHMASDYGIKEVSCTLSGTVRRLSTISLLRRNISTWLIR